MSRPTVSIVVVAFDMVRELPRTVLSLLPPYQRGLTDGEVEIIVADNGSTRPVNAADLPGGEAVRVIRVEDGGVSPCRAINRAAALAQAPLLGVAIDGARLASPGLVATAIQASRALEPAFVATLGFHLGPKTQQVSTTEGYTREVEDELLAGIGWPDDGYRLFEICALGESYRHGVMRPLPETTFFLTPRAAFQRLGGFDERFKGLGGGFANFDIYERSFNDEALNPVLLLGEGTFHQLHYGATTQAGGIRRPADRDRSLGDVYAEEYIAIRGGAPRPPERLPHLFGRLEHPAAVPFFFPGMP